MKVVLKRDKKTGDYYYKEFQIEKGTIGWNVYRWNETYKCHSDYEFSAETLKIVRESLENYK